MTHPRLDIENDPLLRIREAAAYLAMSIRGVQAAVSRGDLEVVRVSPRRVAFRRSALNGFVVARAQRAGK